MLHLNGPFYGTTLRSCTHAGFLSEEKRRVTCNARDLDGGRGSTAAAPALDPPRGPIPTSVADAAAPLGGAGHLQDQERSVGAGLEIDLKEVLRCDSHRYFSILQNKYLFTFSKQILTNPITTKGNDASQNIFSCKGTTRPG